MSSLECVQSSALPPGRIVREAAPSSEYSEHLRYMEALEDAIRLLIVVWYSRGLQICKKVIEEEDFFSEVGNDARDTLPPSVECHMRNGRCARGANVQSSARPPGRIVRQAVSSSEYVIRRLIVVWYSRGIKIIEDAKNVGEGLCSEIAARVENCRNSASVVTDNHPVGNRCLAQRSVAGMHFGNAKIRCKEAVGGRMEI